MHVIMIESISAETADIAAFTASVLEKLKTDYGIVYSGCYDVGSAYDFIAGFHAACSDVSKCAFCLANRRD